MIQQPAMGRRRFHNQVGIDQLLPALVLIHMVEDLYQTLELGAMIEVAQTVAISALQRKESRGAHQRLDFVDRDDVNYLRHTMAYFNPNGDPRIDYADVVITKSQPAARVYGGAAA